MTLDQGIEIAFFLAFLSYLAGVVWVVRRKNRINRRLEIAKENYWVVEGHCVKKSYYDTENDNQLLDAENDYPLKVSLIIPVIVFIAVILIFKLWI